MRKNEMNQSLHQWIWKSFLKTTMIPLFIMVFCILVIYYSVFSWARSTMIDYSNQQVIEDITNLTLSDAHQLENQLDNISRLTQTYGDQVELALNRDYLVDESYRLDYSPEGVYYTTSNSQSDGAAVFYSGVTEVREKERQKVSRLLTTQPYMKSVVSNNPLVASVYFNTYDSLNIIYPYFDVLEQFMPGMDIPSYNFYYEATPTYNPERESVWTDVYLDPAGQGWMISSIAPVFNNDFLEGVVGMDITVGTIVNQVLAMEVPYEGYTMLVGSDGNILALPEGGEQDFGLSELTDHHYEQVILEDTYKPEDFNLFQNDDYETLSLYLKNQDSGYLEASFRGNDRLVFWHTLENTGWKVMVVIDSEKIYERVNLMGNQLKSIGWILLGILFVSLCAFIYFMLQQSKRLSDRLSYPLEEINTVVASIGSGNYNQPMQEFPIEEINATYTYVVTMGNQLGEAHRKVLMTQDNLRENQDYLNALVNSIDDIIMEVNDSGEIIKIWSKDNVDMAIVSQYTDDDAKSGYLERINKVMATGESQTYEFVIELPGNKQWYLAKISLISDVTRRAVISARNITEHKQIEASLRQAKTEAEKANKSKSVFLSNMSHELRTPLNAILGFAQILEMDTDDVLTQNQALSVKQIYKAGKHLLSLIDEVLDLAKIESGKIIVSIEPVDVAHVMHEVYTLVNPIAKRSEIQISMPEYSLDQFYVRADLTRLKQILINLLSNAIKYNKKKGDIQFYCQVLENQVQFHVLDHGDGIARNELNEIFKPFYRSVRADQSIEGTGIGLAVAKQLSILMNGDIYAESTLGKGSHFWIELQLADYTPVKETEIEKMAPVKSVNRLNDQRILYVEDNPANLKLVEQILRRIHGVTMFNATNGELCLDMAIAHQPDLILLDINLPGMSGLDVVSQLKRYEETRTIPVIAVSANAMPSDIEYALKSGFDDYLTKPIDVEKFLDVIMSYLDD